MEDASQRESITDPYRLYIYDVGESISSGAPAKKIAERSWESPLPEKDIIGGVDDMVLKLGDGCGGDYSSRYYLECYSPDFSRKLGTASSREANEVPISFLSTGATGNTTRSSNRQIEVLGEVKPATGFAAPPETAVLFMSYLPDGRFLYVVDDPETEYLVHVFVDGAEVLTKQLPAGYNIDIMRVDEQGNWALSLVSSDPLWLHPDGSLNADGPAEPAYGEMEDRNAFMDKLPQTRYVLGTPYQYNGSIAFDANPPGKDDEKSLFILPAGATDPVEALKLTKPMNILYFGELNFS